MPLGFGPFKWPSRSLMVMADSNMQDLHAGPSTGMNFYMVQNSIGFLAVFQDGAAMPLYTDQQFYCVDDLLAGFAIPKNRLAAPIQTLQASFGARSGALAALRALGISPAYTGAAGAAPLVATDTLSVATTFYRYVNALPDPRFAGANLTAGTYLTSRVDTQHADSGFGVVGRYALPIPLPTSHQVPYDLPAGTLIEVGTVSPNFGQSGGGVEIRLPKATPAVPGAPVTLPDY